MEIKVAQIESEISTLFGNLQTKVLSGVEFLLMNEKKHTEIIQKLVSDNKKYLDKIHETEPDFKLPEDNPQPAQLVRKPQ